MRGCFALSRDSARRKRLNKYVCPDSILHKSHELDQRTRALLQNRVRKKQRYLVSGCQNSPCVYTFGKVWEGWFGRWQACTRAEEKFDERRALFLLAKRTDLQLHVLRFQLYQLLRRAFALAQGKEIGSASRCGSEPASFGLAPLSNKKVSPQRIAARIRRSRSRSRVVGSTAGISRKEHPSCACAEGCSAVGCPQGARNVSIRVK